jgi:hypothetical protein
VPPERYAIIDALLDQSAELEGGTGRKTQSGMVTGSSDWFSDLFVRTVLPAVGPDHVFSTVFGNQLC